VDAPHPLLEAIRVPRNVVVEEDVAHLQVDAFPGRLGRHEHLDGALLKLLFGVKTRARVVARSRLHAAVDEPDGEPPLAQTRHEVVEGVAKLGEDEQPLARIVEKALLAKNRLQLRQLRFAAGVLDRFGLFRQCSQVGHFTAYLFGVRRQRHRIEHFLEPLAVGFFHFLEVFR